MNIYIKVEIKERELDSRILFAFYAASRGHNILIGYESLFRNLLKYRLLKPGIILDKSIRPKYEKIKEIKFFKKKEFKYFSLDEEGGLTHPNIEYFLTKRYSEETIKLVDGIFFWGEKDANYINSKFSNYTNKYFKTGNPRVDLWKPDFDFLYYEKNLIKKNYIFIPSSFGGFLSINNFFDRLSIDRKTDLINNDNDEYIIYDYEVMTIKFAKFFVELIRKISIKFPNINIVVRPHNAEDKKSWKTLIGNLKNVEVIYEGSINKWIRNSKLMIHNGCTSGFEASFANKNIIAYQPFEHYLIRKSSNICSEINTTAEEVLINVQKIFFENKKLHNKKNIISNLFSNNNDFAYKKILTEIEKFDSKNLSKKNNYLIIKIFYFYSILKYKIYQTFNNKILTHTFEKFSKINKNEIKFFNNLSSNLGYSLNFKLLTSRIIFIFSKK